MATFFNKYSWVIGLIFACWNTYNLRSELHEVVAQKPEMAEGYRWFQAGYFAFHFTPWFVMGVGILAGATETVFDYLRPCGGNKFVLAFYVLWVLPLMVLIGWILVGGGAAYFLKYSEGEGSSLARVRLKYGLVLLFVAGWLSTNCMFQR